MPIARFQLEDGRVARFDVPEGTTPEQATEMMQQHFLARPLKPDPITQEENIRASMPARFAAGLAEPLVGAGQLIAHGISAIPGVKGTALDIAPATDAYWKDQARRQEEAKQKAGVGVDVAGFAGNMLSPANAVIAWRGITAAKPLMRMAQGAGMGAAAGAIQPVLSGDYGTAKAGQVATGAALGGVMTGIVDKVAGSAIAKLSRMLKPEDAEVLGAKASIHADDAISAALKETGIPANRLQPAELQAIRQQVIDGWKAGKQMDPAVLMRKADFDAVGMKGLTGQITRDPLQFAQEKNLRGAVPELAQHLQVQGQQLRGKISDLAGDASDNYVGGSLLKDSLSGIDKSLRSGVTDAYAKARASAGKDLNIPLQGLAQDYANVLKDFGDAVPSGIRNHMNDLGLLQGRQTKLFTIEDADKLLKVVSANFSHDPRIQAANTAIKKSIWNAVKSVDASGGPFAPAVKAAADRFALHEAIPALDAAASGKASPDTFVNQFLINTGGKAGTNQTQKLAKLLAENDPIAFKEAQSQIGDTLKRAAFGENIAGDAPFAPDRYAQALRKIGKEKLGAFFSKKQVDEFYRLGRVGTYIDKPPNSSTVNTSNTLTGGMQNAQLLGKLLNLIPGKGAVIGMADAATGAVKNNMAGTAAMKAKIPTTALPLTAEQARLVAILRGGGAVGGGVLGAEAVE